jgi:hypothetical protein
MSSSKTKSATSPNKSKNQQKDNKKNNDNKGIDLNWLLIGSIGTALLAMYAVLFIVDFADHGDITANDVGGSGSGGVFNGQQLWVEEPVPRVSSWPTEPNDQMEIFVRQSPLVFEKNSGHPAMKWTAMNWTPEKIMQKVENLTEAKCSQKPNFMYRSNAQSLKVVAKSIKEQSEYCEFNTTTKTFFK